MCGRYSLTTPMEAVRQLFGFPERPNLPARFNIAPSQEVVAVRLGEGEAGARHLVWLRWGLIPSWAPSGAKEPGIGGRTINARAETVAEKPAFRAAFRRRRCLIPADGFYEWKTERGRKQPYRIVLESGAPFAFAGLWERWDGPRESAGGEAAGDAGIESCTIVTTEANARLRSIHHRMPVILAPETYDLWLDPATPGAQAQALLRPAPSEWFTAYRVSPKINSPTNDDPALIAPLDEADEAPEPPDPQPQLL